MSNETKHLFSPIEEERKLVSFYLDLLDGKAQPSTEYQKQFLLQLLNTKIAVLEQKTDDRKKLHYFLRISVMVLSGLSTVLLGLKFNGNTGLSENLSNITLAITATATLLSSLAVFWDIENYWIRHKVMLNKLKEIRYEYAFFLAGSAEPPSAELKQFLDKFLTNLGDEYWEKFLKDIRNTGTASETTKK